MDATRTKRRYFVAVNHYRSSTDNGFANTRGLYECFDKAHQRRILTLGLPVHDQCHVDSTGKRSPCYSTMGVRVACPSEIREAKRDEQLYSQPIQQMEYHRNGEFR